MIKGSMDALRRNVSYALRVLARTPGFTLTVVLTLALGIGLNSVVFSAIDAILVRPLPYSEPDRLVRVMEVREESEWFIAPVRLEEWNALNSSFEAVSGYFTEDVSDTTRDEPTRVRWAGVAPDFFRAWQVAPLLGRDFTAADYEQRPTSVIISERLWRERFGSNPNVLEQTMRLGDPVGTAYSVIGVLPSSFLFPDGNVDVWFPNFSNFDLARGRSAGRYNFGVGRLRPGVTLEQAQADMDVVQARLAEQYPDPDAAVSVQLRSLKEAIVGDSRASLWLVFGAVSLLLLIACANVAALLLTRAAQREQEVAVRYSLGATRGSVAGQTLTEAGVLALAGALAGLIVATGVSAGLQALAPQLPRLAEVGLDLRVLAYAAASAIIVALLCGLLPAVRDLRHAESLARAGRAQVSGRHGVQWSLVAVQVALSVALLAGAGLLLRSFDELSRVDAGFEPSRVLAFRVSGSNTEFRDSDVAGRITRTLTELAALPGVESAAATLLLPGIGTSNLTELEIMEGVADGSPIQTELRVVSPSYFQTLGVPIATGELCRETGGAMINRSFAARYFPTRSPIGLRIAGNSPAPIMGIVGDAREVGMASEPIPTAYLCANPGATPWFVLRTSGPPGALAASVRARLRELEPTRTVYDLAPLEEHIGGAHADSRLRTVLFTLFAGTALALTCLGIYGTLSYVVTLSRREVGLRVALGAHAGNIVARFVLRTVRVVGLACVVGLALAFILGRILAGMLYGVSPFDPVTLASVVLTVMVVAALAALTPAVRASRIDPMRALREE